MRILIATHIICWFDARLFLSTVSISFLSQFWLKIIAHVEYKCAKMNQIYNFPCTNDTEWLLFSVNDQAYVVHIHGYLANVSVPLSSSLKIETKHTRKHARTHTHTMWTWNARWHIYVCWSFSLYAHCVLVRKFSERMTCHLNICAILSLNVFCLFLHPSSRWNFTVALRMVHLYSVY